MRSEEFIVHNRESFAFLKEDPACVIVQPVDKREVVDLRQEADVSCVLEWNEGNHFRDPSGRCAKGLLWCVNSV